MLSAFNVLAETVSTSLRNDMIVNEHLPAKRSLVNQRESAIFRTVHEALLFNQMFSPHMAF